METASHLATEKMRKESVETSQGQQRSWESVSQQRNNDWNAMTISAKGIGQAC